MEGRGARSEGNSNILLGDHNYSLTNLPPPSLPFPALLTLQSLLSNFPSPPSVSFCHNDLLSANIMRSTSTGSIKLIDFEYGGTNFCCFDIANHFNEFAGGTDNAKPDYGLLPDEGFKRDFITEYVNEMVKGGEGDNEEGKVGNNSEIVETLMGQVGVFEQLNHCYWGLWGVNQAKTEGCGEFDYLMYAKARFGQLEG